MSVSALFALEFVISFGVFLFRIGFIGTLIGTLFIITLKKFRLVRLKFGRDFLELDVLVIAQNLLLVDKVVVAPRESPEDFGDELGVIIRPFGFDNIEFKELVLIRVFLYRLTVLKLQMAHFPESGVKCSSVGNSVLTLHVLLGTLRIFVKSSLRAKGVACLVWSVELGLRMALRFFSEAIEGIHFGLRGLFTLVKLCLLIFKSNGQLHIAFLQLLNLMLESWLPSSHRPHRLLLLLVLGLEGW